jgi:hypothetical protein
VPQHTPLHTPFAQFAEGDSRILMQKLTRDRLKRMLKEGTVATLLKCVGSSNEAVEARLVLQLARKLAPAGRDNALMAKLLDEHWELVYAVADAVAKTHLEEGAKHAASSKLVEGSITQRLVAADTLFDASWKSKLRGSVVK